MLTFPTVNKRSKEPHCQVSKLLKKRDQTAKTFCHKHKKEQTKQVIISVGIQQNLVEDSGESDLHKNFSVVL